MRTAVVALSAVAAAAAGLVAFSVLAQEEDAGGASSGPVEFLGEEVDADALRLGQELYAENCASCHGADLEGQRPDWKRRLENGRMPAPPHDAAGHTWHHSDPSLLLITREGIDAVVPGYESDMPAFGDSLSDQEIRAVLAFIKSTWPERERAFQAEVTRNDTEGDGS